MKKTILTVILGLAVLTGGYFLISGDPATQSPATQTLQNQINGTGQMVMMASSSFPFPRKEINAKVDQPITTHDKNGALTFLLRYTGTHGMRSDRNNYS